MRLLFLLLLFVVQGCDFNDEIIQECLAEERKDGAAGLCRILGVLYEDMGVFMVFDDDHPTLYHVPILVEANDDALVKEVEYRKIGPINYCGPFYGNFAKMTVISSEGIIPVPEFEDVLVVDHCSEPDTSSGND